MANNILMSKNKWFVIFKSLILGNLKKSIYRLNSKLFWNAYLVLLYVFFFCSIGFAQEPSAPDSIHQDTLLARTLISESDEYSENGNYDEALRSLDKALTLYLKNELWQRAVESAVELSILSDNFTTTDNKAKYADLAYHLANRHLDPNSKPSAYAYRQKAEWLMMQGKLDSANYFLKQASPIFRKVEKWEESCWVGILLGVNHLNQSRLDSCQIYLDQVKQILEDHPLEDYDHLTINATLLNLYGVVYQVRGDYDNAIQNTKDALENDMKAAQFQGLDSSYIFLHYNNLGAFYMIKGDNPRALDNFRQASQYNNSANQSALMLNIGELLTRTKDIPESIRYFRKAIEANTSELSKLQNTFQAYKGISGCYSELSQFDSAQYYFEKAESIPLNFRKYEAYLIMGNVFLKQDQIDKAIEYFNKAVEDHHLYSDDDNGNPFFLSIVYRFLGDTYSKNQDVNNALKYYQKALVINHASFKDSLNYRLNPSSQGVYNPYYFIMALWGKAKSLSNLSSKQDDLQISLETYELTIQWIDTLQNNNMTDDAHLNWSSSLKRIYEEAIDVSYRVYQKTKDARYLELAFYFSEKSKNQLLLESLKSTEGKSLANVPDSILQREKDLNLNIAFYEKALRKAKEQEDTDKIKLYQQYFSQNRLALATLHEQLENNFPRYQDWKYGGKSISIKDIQQTLLDSQSAMLEYFTGDSSIYVFVISKNDLQLIPLASPNEIIPVINEFRKVLLDLNFFERNAKEAIQVYNEKASALYQYILKAPLELLSEKVNRLIIVPDGQINSIPFEALTEKTTTDQQINFAKIPYLLYQYQTHYAYSANLLAKNQLRQQQIPANIECLALAPPYAGQYPVGQQQAIFSQRENDNPLFGTSLEIMQIKNFYNGQFDPEITATEEKFKRLAEKYGILHLATHGFADFENSSFNYLKFVERADGQTVGKEDNLLYHYEIANMDLAAQLVVLSACETGVGKYENGEGVFSLARSFMYAGAPSVVMSLWKVSDKGTSQLMPYFYESLSSGKSKDKAMQEAKLRFLEQANLEYRHPFYWSAFVVLGDAQQLKEEPTNLMTWGLIGIALLGFVFFFMKKRKD